MKQIVYISAVSLALGVAGCNKTDEIGTGGGRQPIEGIVLDMGEAETVSGALVRAVGDGYAVNTAEDPTSRNNFLENRSGWFLDFHLYNGKNGSGQVDGAQYADGSFDGGKYAGGSWKPDPDRQLYFPNYFIPEMKAWCYPYSRTATLVKDQSVKAVFVGQDLLYNNKKSVEIAKKVRVQLKHQRAMLDFKFGDVVRSDIDESSVRVFLGGDEHMPYKVRGNGSLEFLLILPAGASSAGGMAVAYNTVGNDLQQPVAYRHSVELNSNNALGGDNCYCFTLSGKELAISPVIILNWTTGEAASGEYVAVTAYPTFKGPVNSTCYFYYDNKLTVDGTLNGTPKFQEINFNSYGECTIKPDGRIITHIFATPNPSADDWISKKLAYPVILGDAGKMYINLETVIHGLFP